VWSQSTSEIASVGQQLMASSIYLDSAGKLQLYRVDVAESDRECSAIEVHIALPQHSS
jgi:hypothetical protein